jgi:hypothetical protein
VAETGATKRAFVTFADIFGLAPYDREQRNLGTPEGRQVATRSEPKTAAIDEDFEPSEPLRQATSQRPTARTIRACRTDEWNSGALWACWTFHRATISRSIRVAPQLASRRQQ